MAGDSALPRLRKLRDERRRIDIETRVLIEEASAEGKSRRNVADAAGVSPSTVQRIVRAAAARGFEHN